MLGLVTIGQSPREDVVASMFGDPSPLGIVQAGALDGLSMDEIERLSPAQSDHPLVTRLRDGCEVTVAKERILGLMRQAVADLERAGAQVICVLCTGSFPPLGGTRQVVYPDRIVAGVVSAIVPAGTIGVLMPHPGQDGVMRRKWSTQHRNVVTASVSPYAPEFRFEEAVALMTRCGVDAIVMDCMGYDRRMQSDVRSRTDSAVLLANGVVGAVLRETIDLSGVTFNQLR
jgi:protein AroM